MGAASMALKRMTAGSMPVSVVVGSESTFIAIRVRGQESVMTSMPIIWYRT